MGILFSGQMESMLITRDEEKSLKPIKLCNDNRYILQTNIDHWTYNNKKAKKKKKIDHEDTMDSIRRLNVGHKCLKQWKDAFNEETMWKLLYQSPIHDKKWTIYSTVMNVKSSYYKTVRHIYT